MQNDHGDHPHDAHHGAEGTNTSRWTFNSIFGIVHAKNCSVCRSYIMHMANANHSCDTSFKAALQDRESRISEAFLDGVQNGQQFQHEDDGSMASRYREERDEALQSLEQKQKELDAAREEIQRLQGPTPAPDDGLAVARNTEAKSPSKSVASSFASSSLLTPTVDLDDVDSDVDVLSPLSSTNQPLPAVINGISISIKASDFQETPSLKAASSSSSSSGSEVLDSSAGTLSYAEIASQSWKTPPPPTPKQETTSFLPSEPTLLTPSTPTSVTTIDSPNITHPTTIAELQALMSSAHAGNDLALKVIKSFCSVMHQIPVNQRTPLHQYVADNWRKPSRVMSAPKQRSFSTEIHVDATAWGIGFVMDGVWIAWKFPSSQPHRNDMGWAKMLAVEVGLRTVIHWVELMVSKEGENFPMLVTVRTDNWAIKRGIEKRQVNKPPRQEILQRILNIVTAFHVQLTVKIVEPAENLASNPARGIPGLGATRLPFTPSLPTFLTDILHPISTNN